MKVDSFYQQPENQCFTAPIRIGCFCKRQRLFPALHVFIRAWWALKHLIFPEVLLRVGIGMRQVIAPEYISNSKEIWHNHIPGLTSIARSGLDWLRAELKRYGLDGDAINRVAFGIEAGSFALTLHRRTGFERNLPGGSVELAFFRAAYPALNHRNGISDAIGHKLG